jgi:hypothetical protein
LTKSRIDSRSLIERLASHDIGRNEYTRIQKIVRFYLPHPMLYFHMRFPGRSPVQLLEEVKLQRRSLELGDMVLTEGEKRQLEQSLAADEFAARLALVDRFASLNEPWKVRATWVPNADGTYIRPSLRITATRTGTKDKREAIIPGESLVGEKWWEAWKRALTELGLLEFAFNRGYRVTKLVTKRKPQGWALFTHVTIPSLYDYMAKFYEERGRPQFPRERARKAFYPNELLQDMLALLRDAQPDVFANYTKQQLKARIQQHLLKKQDAKLKQKQVSAAPR